MNQDDQYRPLVKRIAICNTPDWKVTRQYWNEDWKEWTTIENATLFETVHDSDQTSLEGSWYRTTIHTDRLS